MNARPMLVLLAAHDARLLRQMARFLAEFGYEVATVGDVASAVAACEGRTPDVVIVDDAFGPDGGAAFCRKLRACPAGQAPFVLLLGGAADAEAITTALEAGIDDFLIQPVIYGEVLARLRSAARLAEVDRRARLQVRVDSLTGLANGPALLEQLRHAIGHAAQLPTPAGLVVVDLDWFSRVPLSVGRDAADAALVGVARCLRGLVDPADTVARLEEDTFAVWLADGREQDAAAWADAAREEIGRLVLGSSEAPLRLTASCGVVTEWEANVTAETLLERGDEALRAAKRSGRNAAATWGQFAQEEQTWHDLAAPGKLFEDTTARDVMLPCPTTLHAEDSLAQAVAKFRRTGMSQLPVTDKTGALVGVLSDEALAGVQTGRNSETRRVRDLMAKTVARYQPETPFADLMDFFVRGAGSVLVVMEGGRPVGMVTRCSLTALIEPARGDTFAPSEPFSTSSEFLIVAEA